MPAIPHIAAVHGGLSDVRSDAGTENDPRHALLYTKLWQDVWQAPEA